MIVDAHLDIAWNAVVEGRPFDGAPAPGYLVTRDTLASAGVGLVLATVFTAPPMALKSDPPAPLVYRTPREAHIMARLQVGYYQSVGLQLLHNRRELRQYRQGWRPGQLAAVMLMENADPIETPKQVGDWAKLGLRVVGPAWSRTRYCGGTGAPGGLTPLGRQLLKQMARHGLVLDLSHMADRSVRDSLEAWRGPLVVTHAGARALNPGQRQVADPVIAEVGKRDGMLGISFYRGHLGSVGRGGIDSVVRHALHFARVSGDPRHVGIGSDLDGGFSKDKAALSRTSSYAQLRRALRRSFSQPDVDGILGENWLRFLEGALPA